MKKVFLITEENHGTIGVAASRRAAFQYLVKKNWLHFETDYYLFDQWVPIREIFDDNEWEKTNENLVEWAMVPTLDWDGCFYVEEIELVEEE